MEQDMKNIFSDFAVQMEKDVKYDNYSDKDIINKWTSTLLSLSNEFRKDSINLSFKELYSETLLAVSNKTQNNILTEDFPTGLTALDRIIRGLPMGELIILGARPAMGKTSFLITILANSILGKNEPVAYFSMENSAQFIMLRLMGLISELSHSSIVSKPLQPFEIDMLVEKTKILAEANITIEDDCSTIEEIVSQTYFLVKEKGVKLIIVDYLQLVKAKGKMHREQEVAKVCRELKALARKYNIAILVSSQLSRAVETRGGDKRPQLADLRESGSIEQDADKVLFLHRPEYYAITEDCEGNSTAGIAEIIVAKNRAGYVDSAKVRFVGKFATFRDIQPEEELGYTDTVDSFMKIRENEFGTAKNSVIRKSKMNDIEEDNPF
jgi:replicative DNA helicase